MSIVERLFNSCSLNLLVSESLLELPNDEDLYVDEWLEEVQSKGDRKRVFFDEKLDFFLTVQVKDESLQLSSNLKVIPEPLTALLLHLQPSVDASYISPSPQEHVGNGRLSLPTRTSSAGATNPKGLVVQTSQLPPETPNPTPSSSEADKRYAYSDGTLLKSMVWGEDSADPLDSFRICWSKKSSCWIAIYKFCLTVAFLRTNASDPLLCLTASVTLRDKKLNPTPQRRAMFDKLEFAKEGSSPPESGAQSLKHSRQRSEEHERQLDVLQEVNLLDGLVLGSELYFPSTRLISSVRKAYALPPISPVSPRDSHGTPSVSFPTLRKSFRKTLTTVSGFHVRMRTVFVPHLSFDDETLDTNQRNQNEESTVVLCVEIENSGESGAGFSVERVDVAVGNETAKIGLIGWGDKGFKDTSNVFPLRIQSAEQFNLLYAVSFNQPVQLDSSVNAVGGNPFLEFQRHVTINIIGRPFSSEYDINLDSVLSRKPITYVTKPFLSRWNCTLDLTPRRDRESQIQPHDTVPHAKNALPCPSSPFPPTLTHARSLEDQNSLRRFSSTITEKSNTLSSNRSSLRPISWMVPQTHSRLTPSPNFRDQSWPSTSFINDASSPPLPPLPLLPSGSQTPVYPSHPGVMHTPRPLSALPSFGQASTILGPTQELTQDALGSSKNETSPSQRVATSASDIVLSVSLVPLTSEDEQSSTRPIRILDEFSLDIFVFNQSSSVKIFEVTYQDALRTKRDSHLPSLRFQSQPSSPSMPPFTPLESRLKIGPLGPSMCQSVRMRFLALQAGVHTLDGLLLSELQTGISLNLRSIMDIAILSPDQHISV